MLKTLGRSVRLFGGAAAARFLIARASVRGFASAANTGEGITPLRKPAPAVLEHFPLIFEFGFIVNGVNGALLAHFLTPVSINNLNGGGI